MAKEHETRSAKDRNDLILHMLQSRRSMKVAELCALLKVSEITIRRTLNEMAEKGLITRVHGGAMLVDAVEDGRFFAARAAQNHEVKKLLAQEAAKRLPPNASVYLDSGSTCFEVAKQIASSGREHLVVTDSILVLHELFGLPRLETMLLGGSLARDKVTMDGHIALDNAKRLSLDFCIVSTNSFTVEELNNQYLSGVATKEIMIERAKRSLCVIDSSKFDKRCCFHFCRWEDMDELITDSGLPDEAAAAIAAKGVEVHIVNIQAAN